MKHDNTQHSHVLFVGPIAPPITGQAVAFTAVYEGIEVEKKYLANHNLTGKNIFAKVFGTFRTVLFVTYILLSKKIDVVYFTCSRSFFGSVKDIVVICMARAVGARLVNHLHGADFKLFYESLPAWYRRIVHLAYTKVDTSIVLLEEMKDQFAMFPQMHLEVVHNFYDESLVCTEQERSSHTTRDKPIQLLYFSNIMASKGIFELLDAFEQVSRMHNNVSLRIAGDFVADGNMSREEVKKVFLEKIKALPNTSYLGTVQGEEKRKLLCTSDIFILPSYYRSEAVPLSLIEAMATGNAVVVSDHNYLPHLIPDGNKIVPIQDSTAITEAITFFLTNRDLLQEIQNKNTQYACLHFSQNNFLQSIQKIVDSARLRHYYSNK